MGNSGSQNPAITEVHSNEQWVHSFPRTQIPHSKLNSQHKVLPERNAHLKLRSTNNGEILHSGGTISGRNIRLSDEVGERNREYTKGYEEGSSNDGKQFSQKIAVHGVKQKLSNNISSQQMKSFSSEPDLRYTSMHVNHEFKEKKSKKKYKAPSPPQKYLPGSENPPPMKEGILNPKLPIRKARLFKTRAETKKHSSHLNENTDVNSNIDDYVKDKSKRLSLPEAKLIDSNDFYRELKDATKRLRRVDVENKYKQESNNTNKTKLNTLDPNISSSKHLKEKLMVKIENQSQSKNFMQQCSRGEASGKESTTPDMSPSPTSKNQMTKDHRPKLFYFGMDKNVAKEKQPDKEVFENYDTTRAENSSESDISSDIESDENDTFRSGIDLQLRPILPKKQLEIPRFSPSAAWRLLTMNTNDTTGTMISDDLPLLMEDHIEKYSRPPPPLVNAGQRSSNDKSGDSGISGDDLDAVIPIAYCYDDVTSANDTNTAINQNKLPIKYLNKPERISWTPQQDLGDDSSAEEDLLNDRSAQQNARSHLGPHTFSLSLPRDNRLAAYMIEKSNMPHYSGLQKFKKSLSGVLGNFTNKKDFNESNLSEEKSANWFFSKSAPNSLTHPFHSLERHRIQETDDQAFSPNVATAARLIYLPEILTELNDDKPYEASIKKYKYSAHSKSCEDIGLELERNHPEQLQDPISIDDLPCKIKRKPKKYTFQSTIRQIEKKRLSDKLSREAEKRERKRIRELEAMQKVEEEFQKKRAREKANIRQQLRLFSLDENYGCHSLPANFEVDHKEHRSEPDGAFSSVSSSSCSLNNCQDLSYSKIPNFERKPTSAYTQELSEYRQTQRNYKDYSRNVKYTSDKVYPNRQTTVHPQVSCNMPKVKGLKVKEDHNYRKKFAAGVRSLLSTGSTHSEDSQNHCTKSQNINKLLEPGYNYSNHLVPS